LVWMVEVQGRDKKRLSKGPKVKKKIDRKTRTKVSTGGVQNIKRKRGNINSGCWAQCKPERGQMGEDIKEGPVLLKKKNDTQQKHGQLKALEGSKPGVHRR